MKLMSYKRIEVRTCSLIEIIMKKKYLSLIEVN